MVQRVCDGHISCEDVTRRGWWSRTVVLAAVVELIALSDPGRSRPQGWHLQQSVMQFLQEGAVGCRLQ